MKRAATDISPKVSVPPAILAALAILWGLFNGVDYEAEQLVLAGAALINFVIGYLKTDNAYSGTDFDTPPDPDRAR